MLTFCFRAALVPALLLALPAQAQLPTDSATVPSRPEVALLATDPTSACAHPFGLDVGQRREYQLLDAKGKPVGSQRYQVVSLSTATAGKKKHPVAETVVHLKSGLYDATGHVQQQQDLTFRCRQDTVFTDGLAEINYDGLKSFRDRLFAYKGQALPWPCQPTGGGPLPGGGAQVKVSSPSVAIASVSTTLRERRLRPGTTAVRVPAGTFNCFVVESVRELATAARADLVLKTTGRQVDYYDPGVGIIKTEYFDKGTKLLQSRELLKR